MEDLIERWQWRERIENKLKENISHLSRNIPLYHFLSGIDMKECSARLVECVQAILCKGQNLVSLAALKDDSSRVVLRLVYRNFLDALSVDQRVVSAAYGWQFK